MSNGKSKTVFMTKKDFISGYDKGRYDFIDIQAQKNINQCKKDTDVLVMQLSTGSGLKVLDAQKVDESKFIELTRVAP